jgi:hypothetical protein
MIVYVHIELETERLYMKRRGNGWLRGKNRKLSYSFDRIDIRDKKE